MRKLLPILFIVCLIAVLSVPAAFGSSAGADSYSGLTGSDCMACHRGGVAPTVTVEGPTTLAPGETGNYVMTVLSADPASQFLAGLAVAVAHESGVEIGAFTNVDEDTKSRPDQTALTHSAPKTADSSGITTFAFEYTAPMLKGEYTMFYAGNSANGNGSIMGDGVAAGTMALTVSDEIIITPTLDTEPAVEPNETELMRLFLPQLMHIQ